MVHKKIVLIGESQESFEDAVKDAVDRAQKTIKNIDWIEVNEMSIQTPLPDDPDEWQYQSEVEIAFKVKEIGDEVE